MTGMKEKMRRRMESFRRRMESFRRGEESFSRDGGIMGGIFYCQDIFGCGGVRGKEGE